MSDIQILHEVGEYDLQQPGQLSESDQEKGEEAMKGRVNFGGDPTPGPAPKE